MKEKCLRYVSLAVAAILLVMLCGFLLRPVAKIGSKTVRLCEYLSFAMENIECLTGKMAEDIALDQLAEKAGVTVEDNEIKEEASRRQINGNEGKKLCRKVILHQRLIEEYASGITVTVEEVREYYEAHKEQYAAFEPMFELIKRDIQMELGTAKYEESLERILTENEVKILK